MKKKASDDATDSFLGYLYQLRFALLEALQLSEPTDAVAIEFLDDVAFVSPSSGKTRLHQAKHSITKKANLGPRSLGVWKTLGNWATKVANESISLNSTTCIFNTTGRVSQQSPFRFLGTRNRSETNALKELLDAAAGCQNSAVLKCAQPFVKLPKSKQRHLLERCIVLDASVDIVQAAKEIERILAVSSREHLLTEHRVALEGWFFDATIGALTGNANRFVTLAEIRNQSVSVRDRLTDNFLPEVEIDEVPEEQYADDDRMFVKQLKLICAPESKLRRAQSTHYKALSHRSKWSRDGLLAIDELPKFDQGLRDEWEIRHEAACCESSGMGEAVEIREATRVYDWAEADAPNISHLVIRSFNGPFLVRGSFHILADRLEVGWHPRFQEELNSGDHDCA